MILKRMIALLVNGGRLCAAATAFQRSASTIPFSTYSTTSMMTPATMPPIMTRPRLILPILVPLGLAVGRKDATHAFGTAAVARIAERGKRRRKRRRPREINTVRVRLWRRTDL